MNKTVHYFKTYDWAKEVGFSDEDAKKIAFSNWQIDIRKPGKRYERGRHLNTNLLSLLNGKPTQLWYMTYELSKAIRESNLECLGRSIHSLQDWIGHGNWPMYGFHWKGPWRFKIFGQKIALRKYDPDSDFSEGRLEKLELLTKDLLNIYLEVTRNQSKT